MISKTVYNVCFLRGIRNAAIGGSISLTCFLDYPSVHAPIKQSSSITRLQQRYLWCPLVGAAIQCEREREVANKGWLPFLPLKQEFESRFPSCSLQGLSTSNVNLIPAILQLEVRSLWAPTCEPVSLLRPAGHVGHCEEKYFAGDDLKQIAGS